MAAQNLSAEQTAQLRLQFHAIDKSNRGAIDREEFRSVFNDEDLDTDQIFANADLNNDGEIGFTSFLVASKAVVSEAQLRPVFHRLDADSDGKISVRDLRAILGPTFEGYSCQELLEEVDTDEPGYITWDEFFEYLAQDVDRAVGTRLNARRTAQKECALKTAVDSVATNFRALNCFNLRAAEDDRQGDGAAKWLFKIPLKAASN
jgi:Ca2+-binding EF-hand superfamily protein